jgi:hypothetical protein
MKDFFRGYARIGEIDRFHVGRQPGLQDAAEHGLAAADFPCHLDNALSVSDGVDQRFQNGAPVATFEEHVRVGRNFERSVRKAEKFVIHQVSSSRPGA